MKNVTPINGRVLIKELKESVQIGSIHIADSAESADRVLHGEIVQEVTIHKNDFTSVDEFTFEEGAEILFESIAIRQKVVFKGEDCFFIYAKHIVAVIKK